MATLRRRGGRWQVEVFVSGTRRARSFDSKRDAVAWGVSTEESLRRPARPSATFAEACGDYAKKVAPAHRGARWERIRLRAIAATTLGPLDVATITAADCAGWRDARLAQVQPATVLREINLIRAVLESCRRDWGYIEVNPIKDMRKPTTPAARRRRVPVAEVDAMVGALGYVRGAVPRTSSQRIAVMFLLALETAMRAGELLSLTWGRVAERSVTLPKTKNGDARQVALSVAARELIALLPRREPADPVFDVGKGSRDVLWRRARATAALSLPSVAELHFHDARAEAIWRLSKKIDVLELARMVGHRDPRSLMLYYASTADELAAKLG